MMERTMKKLLSLSIISLLFISLQSFAGRPAEDDSTHDMAPVPEESSSNIPAPETTMQDTVSEETNTETTTNVQQTGDVIQMQGTPANTRFMVINFPVRGMDMSKVLNELGEPNTRFPAVGNPPITRWVYSDRTVFFEYSHVIHVVGR